MSNFKLIKSIIVLGPLVGTGIGTAVSGIAGTSHAGRTGRQATASAGSTSDQADGIGWD